MFSFAGRALINCRGANARNLNFLSALQRPIYIIKSIDKIFVKGSYCQTKQNRKNIWGQVTGTSLSSFPRKLQDNQLTSLPNGGDFHNKQMNDM